MNYPEHWTVAELQELGEWKTGSTPRRSREDYWGGDILWVSPKDMKTDRIVDTGDRMTQKALEETNSQIIPPGSIIVVTRSGILEHSFPVAINEKPVTINQDLKSLELSNQVKSEYVYYYLKSMENDILQNCSKDGTTVASINSDSLYSYEIPVAPPHEQDKIVAKIEKLFSQHRSGVTELESAGRQLEQYQRSVLKAAMTGRITKQWRENVDLDAVSDLLEVLKNEDTDLSARYQHDEPIDYSSMDIPDAWRRVRLSEIAKNIQYGYTESATSEPVGPKFLRISDIQEGRVNWENTPYCEIDDDEKDKYLLEESDLLFARTGGTTGKSFLIKGDIPESVFASYLIRIQLKENVDPEFVYAFFQSGFYWHQIHEGKVGIGQPNVNATKLSKLVLPLPTLSEQQKITEKLDRVLSIATDADRTLDNELERADRLRKSILKQAFNGELVARESSDSHDNESLVSNGESGNQKTLSEVTTDAE